MAGAMKLLRMRLQESFRKMTGGESKTLYINCRGTDQRYIRLEM